MANKYPEHIMKTLRKRLGLKEEDTSRDNLINTYSPSEAFDEMLKWEGIIGYTSTIKWLIQNIYGVDLDTISLYDVPTETDNGMDLSTFIKIGNRTEAYDDFFKFENGFDEDARNNLTFEEFCAELDKGYGNSGCVQIARLYEDENGVIWYDNDYV